MCVHGLSSYSGCIPEDDWLNGYAFKRTRPRKHQLVVNYVFVFVNCIYSSHMMTLAQCKHYRKCIFIMMWVLQFSSRALKLYTFFWRSWREIKIAWKAEILIIAVPTTGLCERGSFSYIRLNRAGSVEAVQGGALLLFTIFVTTNLVVNCVRLNIYTKYMFAYLHVRLGKCIALC